MGIIATALDTLEVKSMKDAVTQLREVVKDVRPSKIVVGYPLLPSGDRSNICDEIDAFIARLGSFFDGPIDKFDEAYSSDEAADVIRAHNKKPGKDKKRVDRLAAVIILQRYLEEHNSAGGTE
jgi:putative Holliday junction resolvase